jgi:hypothetical protein
MVCADLTSLTEPHPSRKLPHMPLIPRSAIEGRSAVVLVYLRGLPRWVVAAVVAALVLGGLFAHGAVSAVLLLLIAAVAGWLCYLSWPRAAPPARTARCVILLLLVIVAMLRIAI